MPLNQSLLTRKISRTIASFWLYFIAGRIPIKAHAVPELTLDRAIPFKAWTIYPYVSLYPLLIGQSYWLLRQPNRLQQWLDWLFWSNVIATGVFISYRTTVGRPVDVTGAGASLTRLIWQLDPPTNAVPSLHTTYAVLVGLAHWHWRTRLRWLMYAWSTAIVASTLTTKQHYIIDVLAGTGLAIAVKRFRG